MKVIQMIQSTFVREDGTLPDPVEFPYYNGDNHVKALASLVSAASQEGHPDDYYRVLSVRIDF